MVRNLAGRLLAVLLTVSLLDGALAQSSLVPTPAPGALEAGEVILLAQADFEAERQEWEQIVNSRDPQDFIRFIEKYPNSVFRSAADAAVLRLPPVTSPAVSPAQVQEQSPTQQAAPVQPATTAADPEEIARATQENLIRLGCLSGRADGEWGRRSEQALSDYARRSGVGLASLDPTVDLLDRLEDETERVCPLACAVTEVAHGDRCVRKTCGRGEELSRRGECVAVAPPPLRCGPGEVKRGNRCVDAPQPQKVTCGPGERIRNGRCVTVTPAPPRVVNEGCPRGAKRQNGYCYFTPFCSAANKGLPGTDVCE